jgi:SM-20-related protein
MHFEFSAAVDWDRIAAAFAEDRRVRIQPLIEQAAIERLRDAALNQASFRQAYADSNGSQEISAEAFRALSSQQQQQLMNYIYSHAARGLGYWYGRHGINASSPEPVRRFLEWFNSEEVLDRVRRLAGAEDVKSASGQVSRFMPGDFLTRHNDEVGAEGRRVAYVMNLAENWHPDCGGLLQFFHPDGRPDEAWTPALNSLCLFDVKLPHSVTCIAPFASQPRLAISGWFRASPKHPLAD